MSDEEQIQKALDTLALMREVSTLANSQIEADGKQLAEKVPPIDISTPPTFLMPFGVYLPIVVK